MHIEMAGNVEVDALEERQHVITGVASAGVVDHLAGGDVPGINEALPIVRKWFSTEYATTATGGTPNRHGVLHGRELTFDTRTNSIKCFVLLLAVWEWANRTLAAEAGRRKADRYTEHAGSDDVAENGWRLDRRGFTDTRLALENLDLAQTTCHRLHGNCATIDELVADTVARTLLQDTIGLTVHVVDDDMWWASRRSTSGWTFAIGRASTAGPWYSDDAGPPTAPPPGTGWRTDGNGNWSGDYYW